MKKPTEKASSPRLLFVVLLALALAAPAVALDVPLTVDRSGPSWLSTDAPVRLGPGLWEQTVHFTLGVDVAAALQLQLHWTGDGVVDPSFVPGAAASASAKMVEAGARGDGNWLVLVAGVNRTPIQAGEIVKVVFHVPQRTIPEGFRVNYGLAVDAEGLIVDQAGSDLSILPVTKSLDPHVDLVLEQVTILPGQIRSQMVRIGSVDNGNPAAVQLDILFDPSALIFKSAQVGSAAQIAEKSVRWSQVTASHVRIVVQGFNTRTIPDGELVVLNWQANGSVPKGTPVSLDCADSIVTDGFGVLIPTTCHGGPVIMVGNMRCDVNLDGRVDVIDVQASINKITHLNGPMVDVNCNGREDVQDVQQITDGALGYDCPTPGAHSCP